MSNDDQEAREFRAFRCGWWAAFYEVHQRPKSYFDDTQNCRKAIDKAWLIFQTDREWERQSIVVQEIVVRMSDDRRT